MISYDLLVIGSGPAGQRAAIYANKLGKRAAVVERMRTVGGVSVNTGTIPSKTMREAVLHLSGYNYRSIYGMNYRVKEKITMADLAFRVQHVIKTEIDVTEAQLSRNGIDVLPGIASFEDATPCESDQRGRHPDLRGEEHYHRHRHQARRLPQGAHQRALHRQQRSDPRSARACPRR